MTFNYEDGSFNEQEIKALKAAEQAIDFAMTKSVPLETFTVMFDTATALNIFVLNSRYERLVRERESNKPLIRRLLKK